MKTRTNIELKDQTAHYRANLNEGGKVRIYIKRKMMMVI